MNAVRRRTAIFAAIAIAAVSWSCVSGPSDAVSPITPAAIGLKPQLLGNQLLACQPLDADSVTQAIGSEGGTLSVGPHQLVVPAGALDSTVSITAVAPSDNVRRVLFYPEGLTFNTPASLTMSYDDCGAVSPLLPKSIVYLDGFDIAELLASLDSSLTKRVTASIEHFSGYAVAW